MKIVKSSIIVYLLLSLMWIPVRVGATDLSNVEEVIGPLIEKKIEEEHIPNLAVAVVADGEVVFEKGYGYANIEENSQVDPETTMFRIGSVSKLFTWIAIMQLVEQGKLDLHTDINQYLDFEIPDKLVIEQDNDPNPITLTHLMTHTPGFEDYSSSIMRLSSEKMQPLHKYVQDYRPERIFPAGGVVAYSNYGTALAGYIVEYISGLPFEVYIEENVLKPLNMDYSTFYQPIQKELSTNFAQAYRYIDGKYEKGKFEFVPGPAGGMSSSALDMTKLIQMYLHGGILDGNRILQEESIQKLFEQQFTHHPRLDGMTLGFKEKSINGKRILYHGGSTTLFDAGLYLSPEDNIGIFIAYSGHNFFIHTEVIQHFMDHYFPLDTNENIQNSRGIRERAAQYAGEYQQNRKSITNDDRFNSLSMGLIQVRVDEDGHLSVTQNGETNTFIEIEPGIYQNIRKGRSPDAYGEFKTILFQKDPHGKWMLATDGPMTYSKALWYESRGFTFLSIILVIGFFVGSLIYWGIRALLRKKQEIHTSMIMAKMAAIITGILIVILIVGVAIASKIDPLYQLPKVALGIEPSWLSIVDCIPYMLIFLGGGMFIFTILLWKKKYWSMIGRIHYSLLTVLIIHLLWIFSYWNLF